MLIIPTGRGGGDYLVIYKHGQGFKLGITENKYSKRSGQDLKSGSPKCKSGAQTTQPRCLLVQPTLKKSTNQEMSLRSILIYEYILDESTTSTCKLISRAAMQRHLMIDTVNLPCFCLLYAIEIVLRQRWRLLMCRTM